MATPTAEMRRLMPEAPLTVTSSVPFARPLLAALPILRRNDFLPKIVDGITEEDRRREVMVQMVRQVDRTGFIPNLIGRFSRASEVEGFMHDIGQSQLDYLAGLGGAVEADVLRMLQGGTASSRALLILDEMQHNLVTCLGESRTPAAVTFRDQNSLTVIHAQYGLDDIGGLNHYLEHMDEYKAHPPLLPVWYSEVVEPGRDRVVDITQRVRVYPMPLGAQLEAITPDVYRRGAATEPPVTSPEGFLLQLGKVGSPAIRQVIREVKGMDITPFLRTPAYTRAVLPSCNEQ